MAEVALPSAQPAAGNEKSTGPSLQFVAFRIDGQEYAFRIEKIQEIVIPQQVTRTPQVAEYVEGVTNLRGTIIPIINLRKLFALAERDRDDETRTIVVNIGQKTIGCTVDAVTQVMRIPRDQIQPAPALVVSAGSSYIAGFARIADRLLVLLDVDELLEPSKLEQVFQSAGLHELPSFN